MTAAELLQLLRQQPFKPLRLHLADGRTREIRHPEMALISESLIAIGVPAEGDRSGPAVEMTFCSVPNIVEVEPFEIEKPNGNGKRKSKKRRGR